MLQYGQSWRPVPGGAVGLVNPAVFGMRAGFFFVFPCFLVFGF